LATIFIDSKWFSSNFLILIPHHSPSHYAHSADIHSYSSSIYLAIASLAFTVVTPFIIFIITKELLIRYPKWVTLTVTLPETPYHPAINETISIHGNLGYNSANRLSLSYGSILVVISTFIFTMF
jgi:hypothetical protein